MASTQPKPIPFNVQLRWEEKRTGILSSPGKHDLKVTTPTPAFEVEPNWNPEILFIASIQSCIMLTFFIFARRARLDFVSYESSGEGIIEEASEPGYMEFSKVTVNIKIGVAREEDADKANEVCAQAEERCLISRSVKSQIVVNITTEVSGS
jgi:organic hydroperoxide reductase OsmC/OhrA